MILLRVFLLFLPCLSFASGPIVHAFFSTMYLDYAKIKDQTQRDLFLIGTLLPDIRYLAAIPRTATHRDVKNLQDVFNEKDPLIAGMKLHCFIDQFRESLVLKHKIYETLPFIPEKAKATFLKLLEDEIVFDKQKLYPEIRAISSIDFSIIVWPLELDPYVVDKWYEQNALYMQAGAVNTLHISSFYKNKFFGIDYDEFKDWSDLILCFSNRDPFVEHVNMVIEAFKEELEKCTPTS